MKKTILIVSILSSVILGCKNQNTEIIETKQLQNTQLVANNQTTFGVRGTCEMCKKTIETAALGVNGVISAIWDIDLKQIEVTYNDQKTDLMKIHNALAAAGYDTDQVKGINTSYENLPKCCQYDPLMEMSLSLTIKE